MQLSTSFLCRKKLSAKNNIAVSANVAYGGVNLMPEGGRGDYENPQMVLKPADGHSDLADRNEITAERIYETISVSQPAAEAPENNSHTSEAVYAIVASS